MSCLVTGRRSGAAGLAPCLVLHCRRNRRCRRSAGYDFRGYGSHGAGYGYAGQRARAAVSAGSNPVERCVPDSCGVVSTWLPNALRFTLGGYRFGNALAILIFMAQLLELINVSWVVYLLLVATQDFQPPRNVMIAFDGSATTRKGVEMIASSPLFRGLPCHLVMAGSESGSTSAQLEWARDILQGADFEVQTAVRAGDAETVLATYAQEQRMDMLVMGAYGHSRIRQLLVGSTTTSMLRTTSVPLLLLR